MNSPPRKVSHLSLKSMLLNQETRSKPVTIITQKVQQQKKKSCDNKTTLNSHTE